MALPPAEPPAPRCTACRYSLRGLQSADQGELDCPECGRRLNIRQLEAEMRIHGEMNMRVRRLWRTFLRIAGSGALVAAIGAGLLAANDWGRDEPYQQAGVLIATAAFFIGVGQCIAYALMAARLARVRNRLRRASGWYPMVRHDNTPGVIGLALGWMLMLVALHAIATGVAWALGGWIGTFIFPLDPIGG